jgi:hypothetical protein
MRTHVIGVCKIAPRDTYFLFFNRRIFIEYLFVNDTMLIDLRSSGMLRSESTLRNIPEAWNYNIIFIHKTN